MSNDANHLKSNVSIAERAYRIRRNALIMGEVQGQGYIAQALGFADVLAGLYFHAVNTKPEDPEWEDRDRVYLSIGHYAIALYSALIELGVIPEDEIETYGTDDSRMPMSGMSSYSPGMEITGGSLGHGLTIAVGACLGLKRKQSKSFVYNLLSDGELGEGSTWEAVMSASHHELDNLIAVVDFNNQQADGPSTQMLCAEPVHDKWEAFGWYTQRIDGNDVDAVVQAFDNAKNHTGKCPRVIICDTKMCKGVKFLEERDKNHFIRIEPHEWALAREVLEEGRD